MDHPRARWCGRSPGVDRSGFSIAYLAFRLGKNEVVMGVSVAQR